MTYLSDVITGIYPPAWVGKWVNPSDNITEICHVLVPSLAVAFNSQGEILHERGHSIGFHHEHFHALANISWKESFMNESTFITRLY
jgi:hypothetical protein